MENREESISKETETIENNQVEVLEERGMVNKEDTEHITSRHNHTEEGIVQ